MDGASRQGNRRALRPRQETETPASVPVSGTVQAGSGTTLRFTFLASDFDRAAYAKLGAELKLGHGANSGLGSPGPRLNSGSSPTSSSGAQAAEQRARRADRVGLLVVTGDIRAPRLGADRRLGPPDDIELTVRPDFADHHRFVQMVVAVHLEREAAR